MLNVMNIAYHLKQIAHAIKLTANFRFKCTLVTSIFIFYVTLSFFRLFFFLSRQLYRFLFAVKLVISELSRQLFLTMISERYD